MYKVIRFIPSTKDSLTTSPSPVDQMAEPESAEEDVKAGFLTKPDAHTFIGELYKSNPLTRYLYRVKEEA